MSFQSAFLHTIVSQSGFHKEKNLAALLPAAISYSAEAAEHLLYLKAAGVIEFPANAGYTQNGFHSWLLLRSLSGNAGLSTAEGERPIRSGDICFIDCRQKYSLSCPVPWRFQALFFDGYSVSHYYEVFRAANSPVVPLEKHSLLPALLDRIIAQNYIYAELINAELLTRILTHIATSNYTIRAEAAMPSWLIQLKAALDNDYAMHFSLDELSEQFHINKYQICRDFKKYLKTSPLQYLNNVRLEHAKELLTNTSLHVNEISYQIGFENTNHFIQLFKKEVGMTPTIYRKKDY